MTKPIAFSYFDFGFLELLEFSILMLLLKLKRRESIHKRHVILLMFLDCNCLHTDICIEFLNSTNELLKE